MDNDELLTEEFHDALNSENMKLFDLLDQAEVDGDVEKISMYRERINYIQKELGISRNFFSLTR